MWPNVFRKITASLLVLFFSILIFSRPAIAEMRDNDTYKDIGASYWDETDKTNNAVIVGSILLLIGLFIGYYIMYSPSKVPNPDQNQDSTELSTEPQTENPVEIR